MRRMSKKRATMTEQQLRGLYLNLTASDDPVKVARGQRLLTGLQRLLTRVAPIQKPLRLKDRVKRERQEMREAAQALRDARYAVKLAEKAAAEKLAKGETPAAPFYAPLGHTARSLVAIEESRKLS